MPSVTNTCNGTAGSKYNITLNYVINSQSISANTSNITVYATVQRNDGYSASAYNGYENQNHTTLTVGGSAKVDENFILDTRNSRLQELSRWTGNVTHNADGTLTLALSASFTTDLAPSLTGGSVSTMWTLTTISRTSDFTVTPSSVDAGGSVTIKVIPASSSFTHTATIGFYGQTLTLDFPAGTTQKTATIPKDWLYQMTSATSGSATVIVATKSGSTTIGSDAASLTIRAPASVVPTIGDLAITRIDNGVPADWGVYVQGYSKAQVQITGAAGAYGSTIRSYAINSSGFSASGQTATIGPITLSGAVDIWGTVIDSRLRSAVMTKTIQVVPYSKPWFTSTPAVIRSNAAGEEDANGEYIAITAEWDCAVKDKNTCAGTYRITPVSGSASELTGALTSGVQTVVQASSDYSWAVAITLTDALASSPYTATVPTGSTLMDFRAGGKGIAIGKVAETDGFDVDMVTKFRRDVSMLGALTLPVFGLLKSTLSGVIAATAGTDYATPAQLEAKQNKITASGILKGGGSGSVSAATAGTDYEQVTIGGTTSSRYAKFAGGLLICWGKQNFGTRSITNAWGNLYESTAICQFSNFAYTFSEVPAVMAMQNHEAYSSFFVEGMSSTTTTNPGYFYADRPNSATITVCASYIAIGRWK